MAQPKEKSHLGKIVFLLILLGLFIRTLISPLNQTGDIAVHQEWSRVLYKIGLTGSYFYPIWTYTPPTQPPAMTFLFWLSQHFYQNRFYIAQIHNLTHFPPSSFIIWFDQNGEFVLLKFWAIVGDILSALLTYYFIFKLNQNRRLALLGLALVLFNPLTIYESAHWGQNDIVGAVFIYLSLLTLNSTHLPVFTIPLLFMGISLKPTVLVVLPIFFLFYLKAISLKNTLYQFLGLFLAILLILVTFIPFTRHQDPLLPQITNIITHRITTSSKGTIRASNSAFNFYALFFILDRTPGNQLFLFFDLNTLGYILVSLIAVAITTIVIKSTLNYQLQLFILYFFSQGYFLFSTGMLERYFFPAFLASVILLTLNYHHLRYWFILQNILWLLNLIFARTPSFFLVKGLSAISLINYLIIGFIFYRQQFKFHRSIG